MMHGVAQTGTAGRTLKGDRRLAVGAHGFFWVVPALGPLVLWLMMRRRSAWVSRHCAAAFDFQVTYLLFFAALVPVSVYQNREPAPDFGGSETIEFLLGLAAPLAVAVWITGIVQTCYRMSDAHRDVLSPYRWSLRLLRRRA
jgi:uncharacterized Tic20 family protein